MLNDVEYNDKSVNIITEDDLDYWGFLRKKSLEINDISQLDNLYNVSDSGYYYFGGRIPFLGNDEIYWGTSIVISYGEYNVVQIIIASGKLLYRFRQGEPSKWGNWNLVTYTPYSS